MRYNEHGTLTFVCRKDAQIKIRGQRVELGEIEHTLRSHDCVDNSVAILRQDDKQETWIASFVTICNGDSAWKERPSDVEETQQQLTQWETQFDSQTYVSIDLIQPELIGKRLHRMGIYVRWNQHRRWRNE